MKCPSCQSGNNNVIDSRQRGNLRYRKRECNKCGHRFSTTEMLGEVKDNLPLIKPMVCKKNGKLVLFDSNKLMQSVSVAVRKSQRANVPINDIVAHIEQEVTSTLDAPMPTTKIGEMVLKMLVEHDRLAYLRYLSVHHKIETDEEIQEFINDLQALLRRDNNDDNV